MEIGFRFFRIMTAVLVGTSLILGIHLRMEAQEETNNYLPDAPSAETGMVHGVMKGTPAVAPAVKRPWLNVNRVSIVVLIAGAAIDGWSTHANLTHPKWICGYSAAFGNSPTYISDDGARYDAQTIQNVLCGPGPSGEQANYAYDVTRTGAYTETGWVTKFGLAGKRNFAGVEAWNLADDAGQFLIARYLARRKGPMRRIAAGMNFSRGIIQMQCGFLNIQFARKNSNPSAWEFHLPNEAALYPTPRWWGRR